MLNAIARWPQNRATNLIRGLVCLSTVMAAAAAIATPDANNDNAPPAEKPAVQQNLNSDVQKLINTKTGQVITVDWKKDDQRIAFTTRADAGEFEDLINYRAAQARLKNQKPKTDVKPAGTTSAPATSGGSVSNSNADGKEIKTAASVYPPRNTSVTPPTEKPNENPPASTGTSTAGAGTTTANAEKETVATPPASTTITPPATTAASGAPTERRATWFPDLNLNLNPNAPQSTRPTSGNGQIGLPDNNPRTSLNRVDFSGALEYWGNPDGAGAIHLRPRYTFNGGSIGYTHIALLPGAKGVPPYYMTQSYATIQLGNQESAPRLHVGQRNTLHLDPHDPTNYAFNANFFRPTGTGVFVDTYNPRNMQRTRLSAYNEVGGNGNRGVLQVDQQFGSRFGKDSILWGEASISTRNGGTAYLFTQYQKDKLTLNAQAGISGRGGGVSLGVAYEFLPNLSVGVNYNNYHVRGLYGDRWQNELRGSVFYKIPINDRYWFSAGVDTHLAGRGNSGGIQARPVLSLGIRF